MKEELISSDEGGREAQIRHFFHTAQVPSESVDYFRSISWTRRVLDKDNYQLQPMFSRHPKPNDEDVAISQTLNTPTTFPHWLQLFRKNVDTFAPGQTVGSSPTPKRNAIMESAPDTVFLLSIGPRALGANAGYVHGGIVSLILDNCMSSIITFHCLKLGSEAFEGSIFTAKLEVGFFAPVKCDSNVIVNCWLLGRQRNKWSIRAQIENEAGQVLAQGDSLWIVVGPKL